MKTYDELNKLLRTSWRAAMYEAVTALARGQPLSEEKLAEALGLPLSTLSGILGGNIHASASDARKFAGHFGITWSTFLLLLEMRQREIEQLTILANTRRDDFQATIRSVKGE